jgi:mannose-6-phosphate isomerase-like protein (cupin superfamily)
VKRFFAGVLAGWLAVTLAVLAQRTASEKTVRPQLLADNQKVKIVRWSLLPGERSPVHTHSLDHIYVVIHGSRIRDFVSGGATHDDDQETGRAAYSPAVGKTHYFQNVGSTPYEMVSIELK